DVRFQIVHERIETSRQYLDQGNACDSALGVLVLRDCRSNGQEGKARGCNCESDSLFHSPKFLLEIEIGASVIDYGNSTKGPRQQVLALMRSRPRSSVWSNVSTLSKPPRVAPRRYEVVCRVSIYGSDAL